MVLDSRPVSSYPVMSAAVTATWAKVPPLTRRSTRYSDSALLWSDQLRSIRVSETALAERPVGGASGVEAVTVLDEHPPALQAETR